MTLLLTNGTQAGRAALPPIPPETAGLIEWTRRTSIVNVAVESSLSPQRMTERTLLITEVLEEILSHGVPQGGINE